MIQRRVHSVGDGELVVFINDEGVEDANLAGLADLFDNAIHHRQILGDRAALAAINDQGRLSAVEQKTVRSGFEARRQNAVGLGLDDAGVQLQRSMDGANEFRRWNRFRQHGLKVGVKGRYFVADGD